MNEPLFSTDIATDDPLSSIRTAIITDRKRLRLKYDYVLVCNAALRDEMLKDSVPESEEPDLLRFRWGSVTFEITNTTRPYLERYEWRSLSEAA